MYIQRMTRRAIALLFAAACASSGDARVPRAGPQGESDAAPAFAAHLGEAFAARDPQRVAGLFSADATAALIGEPGEARGRPAIEAAAAAVLDRYGGVRIAIGRIWISRAASVIELVLGGHRGGRPVGVAAAVVVTLDEAGRVTALRAYVDAVTVLGQVDPARVPEGTELRPVATAPPAGAAVRASRGTADEAAHLAITNRIWAALDAHDPAAVMAPTADGYIYIDLAAPRPLDRAGTEQLVARFVTAVDDFRIADKPVQLAAGDDVVTEMVEHARFRGRPIVLHGLDIKRFASGRVVAEWQYSNTAELLRQAFGVELSLTRE